MIQLNRVRALALAAIIASMLMSAPASFAQEKSGVAPNPAGDILGVWNGTTRAGCALNSPPSRCNAVQKVSITIVKGDNGKLGGYYRCSYGSQDCYNMNETGKVVTVSTTGPQLSLRVEMPDGTACIFTGHITGDALNGGYDCMSGGAPIERGAWLAQHY